MELVHVVCGENSICFAEGAEHLKRQFEIDHIDYLIAVLSELAAGDS